MKRIATIVENGKVTGVVHGPDYANQVITDARGKKWYFDFCAYSGPLWTKKNGDAAKNQNPPKAVWDAFEVWLKTARKSK